MPHVTKWKKRGRFFSKKSKEDSVKMQFANCPNCKALLVSLASRKKGRCLTC